MEPEKVRDQATFIKNEIQERDSLIQKLRAEVDAVHRDFQDYRHLVAEEIDMMTNICNAVGIETPDGEVTPPIPRTYIKPLQKEERSTG